MDEVAAFLRRHPPFDALDAAEVAAVAARGAGRSAIAAGAPILERPRGARPSSAFVRPPRGGRAASATAALLDLLGEGELFGFASILAEQPARVRRARARGHASSTASPTTRSGPCWSGPAALRVRRAHALGAPAARAGPIPGRRRSAPAGRSPS